MADQYIASLLNPFDSTFNQPKLLDGSVTRSAGVRFRNVGNVSLPADGSALYFVLFPGFSYCLNWKTPTGAASMPSINPSHLGTPTDRANVRKVRLVTCGLRLSLENTSDDNEGSWEAVRIPLTNDDFIQIDTTSPNAEDFAVKVVDTFAMPDLANHATFQTGRLKDIHRFQFKLNSVEPDHQFVSLSSQLGNTSSGVLAVNDCNRFVDNAFDVVVIKVNGRIDATVPSVIRYDLVSNQEVVYKDGTALGRIMSTNVMLPQMDVILDKTRYMLPAIQVA